MPYRYTGKFTDYSTGFVQMDSRWYNGHNGWFIQLDNWNLRNTHLPKAVQHELMPFTGVNTQMLLNDPSQQMAYGYVRGNPLKYVDPYGLYLDPFSNSVPLDNKKVDSTAEAVGKYFFSNEKTHELGDKTKDEITNSKEVLERVDELKLGNEFTHNRVDIDLIEGTFHVGRTKVFHEKAVCNGSKCSVTFKGPYTNPKGELDGFDDPLDQGYEIPGGTPFKYREFEFTHQYTKPKDCN